MPVTACSRSCRTTSRVIAFRGTRTSYTPQNSSRRSECRSLPETTRNVQLSLAVAVSGCALSALLCSPVLALGMESPELPFEIDAETPEQYASRTEAQRSTLDAAEDTFKNSQTLKDLLARSEQNRIKNKKQILNKYCYRQAEWGVGDCGGLNLIPGATENGKQKTPEWLLKLLGAQQDDSAQVSSKTLLDQQ